MTPLFTVLGLAVGFLLTRHYYTKILSNSSEYMFHTVKRNVTPEQLRNIIDDMNNPKDGGQTPAI